VSTDNSMPSDDDLFSVLTRGMPGSAMPSWAHFPEADRWALVFEVRKLARDGIRARLQPSVDDESMTAEEADDLAASKVAAGTTTEPPAEPERSGESLFRGRRLYTTSCQSCHGVTGRGDGVESQIDDHGNPIHPRDLT